MKTSNKVVISGTNYLWRQLSLQSTDLRKKLYKFAMGAAVMLMGILGPASFATAADVSITGELGIRSRDFTELDMTKHDADAHQAYTQERILLEVNAKSDDVKAKLAIWNDFDTWGRFESPQGNQTSAESWSPYLTSPTPANSGYLTIREAWVDFKLPDLPIGIRAGHQFVTFGQGWFFRSAYFGSDAWVVYMPVGDHTISLVDVKAFEGTTTNSNDDIDAYTAAGAFKLSDTMKGGIDVTVIRDRAGKLAAGYTKVLTGIAAPAGADQMTLTDVGLNIAGDVSGAKVKAEVDVQDGKWEHGASDGGDMKFLGNQIIAQGSYPIDTITINATLARGSGDKFDPVSGTGNKYEGMVNLLDLTQHYTYLYEYKVKTAAGALYTGFANTSAVSIGIMKKVSSRLDVGGDLWFLQATEKTNINPVTGGYGTGSLSRDLGNEVDLKANITLGPTLTWNFVGAYFQPGDVYKQANGSGNSAARGLQGLLIYKF